MSRRLSACIAAFLVSLVSAAAPRLSFAQVEDLTPPALAGLSVSPPSIDVSGADQVVTLTLHITDALSGFSFGQLQFNSPSGNQVRTTAFSATSLVSGDVRDGIYSVSMTFPQFSEAGTWHLYYLLLIDTVSNTRTLFEPDLTTLGLPTSLDVSGGPDLGAPQLPALSLDPPIVDVTGAAQTETLTFHITDALSGFSFGQFQISSPSGQQVRTSGFGAWNLVSGDAHDGIYNVPVTYPQFSESGTWHIYYVLLFDAVGNTRTLFEPDLIALGLPTTLDVIAVPDDTTPAQLDGLSLNPTSFNVSGGAQTVTLTFHVTDALSGLTFGQFQINSPSGQQHSTSAFGPWNLVSGDARDGMYDVAVTFPQFSEAGTWHLSYVLLIDAVGNNRILSEPDLISLGFPTTLQVTQNTAPTARAESTGAGACAAPTGTAVTLDGSTSSDPDGDSLTYTWREHGSAIAGPSGNPVAQVTLALGVHVIQLTVDDGNGGSDTTDVVVAVVDATPPALTVSLSPNVLWPPDHKLVAVSAAIQATDACDADVRIELLSVTSNEPDNGLGDGDTTDDIQQAVAGTDDRAFQLRAERAGHGTGRIYIVTYRATDASGNSTTVTATVIVPKNQK